MSELLPPESGFRLDVTFSAPDADAFGRVRPDAVLVRMQDAAEGHSNARHMGRDEAMARGSFWAAARTEVSAEQAIPIDVPLRLDTWCGKTSFGLFHRHYRLSDGGGRVVLRGHTLWVLMDWESRTLARDWRWAVIPPSAVEGALPENTRRLVFPPLTPAGERTVTDAESDVNGHLNNALYIPWGEALLGEDWLAAHRLTALRIEYHRELPRGETAALFSAREGNTLYVLGRLREQKAFEMRLDYDSL